MSSIKLLCAMHLGGVRHFVVAGEHQSLGGAALSALGFCLNWYEGKTGWLPGGWDVLWSLSIEETFYLTFPLVCRVLRDSRVLAVALAVLAASLPFTRAALAGHEIWQEKAYLPGMSAIATGVLVAMLARRWYLPALALSWLLGAVVARLFSGPANRELLRRFHAGTTAATGR